MLDCLPTKSSDAVDAHGADAVDLGYHPSDSIHCAHRVHPWRAESALIPVIKQGVIQLSVEVSSIITITSHGMPAPGEGQY